MDIDKLLADSSEDSEETVATKETVSSEENVGKPLRLLERKRQSLRRKVNRGVATLL